MIISLKKDVRKEEMSHLIGWLESYGVRTHISEGEFQTIIGLIGDTTRIDTDLISGLDIVENVTRISEPFKKANRKFHPEDTVIRIVEGAEIGGGHFQFIAGPCSVESESQMETVANAVKASGAGLLRGGAFKPRTSPYDFQGLHEEGIRLLLETKRRTGMPIVTEIMDIAHLPLFENVDVIQVGARNTQNFELLKELGHTHKPILLKRGIAGTIKELLMSAEYVMAGGNEQVILCERGIRSYETYTRNTLDLSAVAVLHEMSHLPVIVDPSHATGVARYVKPMALAAAACGADGLMIEVHNDPPHAKCDGPQSLTPAQFDDVAKAVRAVRGAIGGN
ncbi:MAG: 3-deoxy-7-phosphoheptulonate synthase [Clostridia bacterium]|nr:3-deoxy-7-phosphoheptulonate synthase [Clostridia bacterium]